VTDPYGQPNPYSQQPGLGTPPGGFDQASQQYPQPAYPQQPGYPQQAYPPAGYPPPGYAPRTAGTNGLAVAALVLGILWIYWIGSILAVIFGHIALRQIPARNQGGRGLAIAGVVLGWIGVGTLLLWVVFVVVLGVGGYLNN
jgi:hypothetical protein